MKARLLTILLAGLLLAGCGTTNTDTQKEGSLTSQAGAQGDTQGNLQESSQEDTQGNAQEDSEEESYVLSFEAETVDGEKIDGSCFSDSKLTMLNVWATYCNPCLSEMPDLGEMAASYDASDFQIIGIVSDVAEGADEADIKEAKELIKETSADYPHLLLSQSLYSNLVGAIDSVPTTFFVNQKGEVLGYVVGARSKEDWEAIVDEILAEMQ